MNPLCDALSNFIDTHRPLQIPTQSIYTLSCKQAPMADVVRALQHVHNQVDAEHQWNRAVRGLSTMSDLEIAMVWNTLSSPLLIMEPHTSLITHSQLKCIYDRAVKHATANSCDSNTQTCCDSGLSATMRLLKKFDGVLRVYEHTLTRHYAMSGVSPPDCIDLERRVDDDAFSNASAKSPGNLETGISKLSRQIESTEKTLEEIHKKLKAVAERSTGGAQASTPVNEPGISKTADETAEAYRQLPAKIEETMKDLLRLRLKDIDNMTEMVEQSERNETELQNSTKEALNGVKETLTQIQSDTHSIISESLAPTSKVIVSLERKLDLLQKEIQDKIVKDNKIKERMDRIEEQELELKGVSETLVGSLEKISVVEESITKTMDQIIQQRQTNVEEKITRIEDVLQNILSGEKNRLAGNIDQTIELVENHTLSTNAELVTITQNFVTSVKDNDRSDTSLDAETNNFISNVDGTLDKSRKFMSLILEELDPWADSTESELNNEEHTELQDGDPRQSITTQSNTNPQSQSKRNRIDPRLSQNPLAQDPRPGKKHHMTREENDEYLRRRRNNFRR